MDFFNRGSDHHPWGADADDSDQSTDRLFGCLYQSFLCGISTVLMCTGFACLGIVGDYMDAYDYPDEDGDHPCFRLVFDDVSKYMVIVGDRATMMVIVWLPDHI